MVLIFQHRLQVFDFLRLCCDLFAQHSYLKWTFQFKNRIKISKSNKKSNQKSNQKLNLNFIEHKSRDGADGRKIYFYVSDLFNRISHPNRGNIPKRDAKIRRRLLRILPPKKRWQNEFFTKVTAATPLPTPHQYISQSLSYVFHTVLYTPHIPHCIVSAECIILCILYVLYVLRYTYVCTVCTVCTIFIPYVPNVSFCIYRMYCMYQICIWCIKKIRQRIAHSSINLLHTSKQKFYQQFFPSQKT